MCDGKKYTQNDMNLAMGTSYRQGLKDRFEWLLDKLNTINRYDLVGEYELYMKKRDTGEYVEIDDVIDLIK